MAGESSAAVDAPGKGLAVTVAVPVYGGGEIVDRCFERLVANTDLSRHRLLVVLDGDQSFQARPIAATLRQAAGVEWLERPERGGFAAAANDAFAACSGDVVLVNSDVLVPAGWLERLQAAAASRPLVATVTPWSNDATLCSLPRAFRSNPLPPGASIDQVDEQVAGLSGRRRPTLPTGVGSCLYIRREVLDQVGSFDVAAFGFGYGEEVDFCQRAVAAGFVHLLDDATYVFHRGQSSFGFERAARVARAERIVARRYPQYRASIAAAMRDDPAAAARADVVAACEAKCRTPALPAPSPQRVFHLVHGYPPWSRAGTELYAERLVREQGRHREVMVHARVGGSGAPRGATIEHADADASVLVRLIANDFSSRNPVVRNAIRDPLLARDVGASLDRFEPDLVHFHHLAGHGASVVFEARRRGLPIVFQVQDWWPLCARANLLDANRRWCPGPSPTRCSSCLPLTAIFPASGWSRLLYRLRAAVLRRALAAADVLVMGSEAIRSSYAELGWLPSGVPVEVLDYGTPEPPTLAPRGPASRPIRLGFVGSLLPHKGAHVAVAAMAEFDPALVVLQLWGDPSADPRYTAELRAAAGPAVSLRGQFEEARREEVFGSFDLLLVPSLGLESYGLVVREAFARGIPVLASDRGALPEAFANSPAGRVVAAGDVASWTRAIAAVVEDVGVLDRWRAAIGPQLGVAAHAEAIEGVYRRVLEGRG